MKRASALLTTLLLFAAACGVEDEPVLAGTELEPNFDVGGQSLPAVNRGGEDFAFRADEGEMLLVYFAFTNCPDFGNMALIYLSPTADPWANHVSIAVEWYLVFVPFRKADRFHLHVRAFGQKSSQRAPAAAYFENTVPLRQVQPLGNGAQLAHLALIEPSQELAGHVRTWCRLIENRAGLDHCLTKPRRIEIIPQIVMRMDIAP